MRSNAPAWKLLDVGYAFAEPAYLAGLSSGVYANLDELAAQWQVERRFHPTMPRDRAQDLMARWERAVRQTVAT